MIGFAHLHVHSHYSRGWGMGTVQELCRAAVDLEMTHLALTDTNGLYGAVFFVQAARDAGIAPVLGSELVCAGGRRALLIAKNREGYSNLCRLISDRHCHGRFDLLRSLRERRAGLVVCSDDFPLLKALKCDRSGDLFVEMSPGYRMAPCYSFSRAAGIPPLATNRVFMVRREQFELHRILRAANLNTTCSRLGRDETCREHNYLCSPRVMTDHFPHAPEAVENAAAVADACRVCWDWDEMVFPRFGDLDDRKAFDRLYSAVIEGCMRRYGSISREVRARVDHEMEIIRAKNFAHYFLLVADVTSRVPRSCGRGSSAASIVSYALGITHVDPIAHNLFFERFLNRERMDPPDIDVDFPWDEREQVLDYVSAAYGARRSAMVGTHATFGARAAVRAVAKVFGLTDQEINAFTGSIRFRHSLKRTLEAAGHAGFSRAKFSPPWDRILEAAAALEGHFAHLSTHCGGVVVVPDEIRRYCPVEISTGGLQVLQWEKESVEDAGLVKMDFLGNRSLSVIRDSLAMVEANYGRRIAYADLNPIGDRKAAEVFYRAETIGVFYFESPATRQVLTKVRYGMSFEQYFNSDHFQRNVVVTSIIRPASNRSVNLWVSRIHGAPWAPPHPLLGPVLDETLGLMVFQEQLSQAAVRVGGFDPGEADTLRRVVSKKHREKKLRDFHRRFLEGALLRGVPPAAAEDVWRMMTGFDGYSFCKPHSASYTMVAYKSAFLRGRYPAEFIAAVVSNGGGYYSTYAYLSEARRMGLRVLPPDINRSGRACTGRGRSLQMGFMLIRGLSGETVEAVVHERTEKGPFGSLGEFMARMGASVHLHDLRALIKAGCMDGSAGGASRAELLLDAFRFHHLKSNRKGPGLFSVDIATRPSPAAGNLPADTLLSHELESFGFPVSVHPLSHHRQRLGRLGCVPAADLHLRAGRTVKTAGIMISGKAVSTARGEPMKFVSFEDESAVYEAVFFPDAYRRYGRMLNYSRPCVLQGTVEKSFGAVTLKVHRMHFLEGGPAIGV